MPRPTTGARGRKQRSGGRNPKGEADRRFRAVSAVVDSYRGRCLFPADGNSGLCKSPPSKRHVIPRRSVLNQLKDEKSGMVLDFDWGVGQWKNLVLRSDADHPIDLDNPATFEPRPVGTHEACTGLFACQPHDDVFNPSLDNDRPDFDNPNTRLLAAGRAVLYAADLASKRKFIVEKMNKQSMRVPDVRLRMQWEKRRLITYKTHRTAHTTAERWRGIWESADRAGERPEDSVDWVPLSFRSTLAFAACIFYGQATAVMVLPRDGEHHDLAMLYFGDDSREAKEDGEQLAERAKATAVSDSYGVSMMNELMSRGSGAIAASPASYEQLRDEDKLRLRQIIMKSLNSAEISQSLRNE